MHAAMQSTCGRGKFHELESFPHEIKKLVKDAADSAGWALGIESDRRGRGTAINVDVYGYQEAEPLAVVQVRETVFAPDRYPRVRKNYFLIGYNENGHAFAHCVPSPLRSKSALATPQATVDWVLSKIWGVPMSDLGDIERQGDVAFVPVRSIPDDAERLDNVTEIVVAESHQVRAKEICKGKDGTIYVRRGARLVHRKGQHATVRAKAGLYRVVAGYREQAWRFSLESHD